MGPAATPLWYELFQEVKHLKGLLVPKGFYLLEYPREGKKQTSFPDV